MRGWCYNMFEAILVAVITGAFALAGTIISNVTTHSKTMYRIEQLEKKQDKHNNLIERTYAIEKSIELLDERQKVANHRINDIEKILQSE